MLKEHEFNVIKDKIKVLTGIHLGEHKKTLAHSRVSRRISALNLQSVKEYLDYLESTPDEEREFVNVLTTNKTEFFREVEHFHFLEKYLSENKWQDTLLTWSAASSTGQEIYSLASLYEGLSRKGIIPDYRILGSDIDTEVLSTAQNGVYPREQLDLNPMPKSAKEIWSEKDGNIVIDQNIKNKLKWRQVNLKNPVLNQPIKFDIIFLRNVLIYFEKPTIIKTIENLLPSLKPGGLLFISLSETLNGLDLPLKHRAPSVYEYDCK